jgi:hypothetical protein
MPPTSLLRPRHEGVTAELRPPVTAASHVGRAGAVRAVPGQAVLVATAGLVPRETTPCGRASIPGVADVELGQFYREYVERVVNQHDLSAVDEMVSPDYVGGGHGWAETIEALREFYRRQSRTRPDWRIDIQQTVAVGEWVAVRAFAGGQEAYNEDGSRQSPPFPTSVEWLSTIRVAEAKIAEIRIVSWVDHTPS